MRVFYASQIAAELTSELSLAQTHNEELILALRLTDITHIVLTRCYAPLAAMPPSLLSPPSFEAKLLKRVSLTHPPCPWLWLVLTSMFVLLLPYLLDYTPPSNKRPPLFGG